MTDDGSLMFASMGNGGVMGYIGSIRNDLGSRVLLREKWSKR